MDLIVIVVWIAVISALTLVGAYYARRSNRPDALVTLYTATIIVANLAASKIVEFDFGFTKLFAPVAVLFFSITFLLTDIVNEKFGRKETQKMIIIALFVQISVVIFSFLIVKSEPANFFTNQAAFEAIFGNVPRIMLASFIAFFISENADAYLFHWFRRLTKGKHLWMRNVFSSIPAMALDSILVVVIAFYGVLPIMPLIIGLTVIKWLAGIVDIPFMYMARAIIGKNSIRDPTSIPYSGI
jgi:uncharacterized integral membrane protein (TIGR00697 family)